MGPMKTYDASRYFYEELEDGIRNIVVTRLDRDFTVADYENGLPFSIDHYAPGTYGQPVKGYLLSVSRVDVANSNGTFDQDVATFTAYREVPTVFTGSSIKIVLLLSDREKRSM